MKLDEQTGKKIQELQFLEQNLQTFSVQKQTFQIELTEVLNALSDLKKSDEEVYKITSGLMIRSNKEDLVSDLEGKKKIIELRISSIEKQEKLLEEKAGKLKKEITGFVSENKKAA